MEKYIKDFDAWNIRIKELDSTKFDDFFHAREIWWGAFGVNVGSEQDGKNENFERPLLIIRKIRHDLIVVAPCTSKISPLDHRVLVDILGKESQILLDQVRTISTKRLLRRIGYIKKNVFQEVIIVFLRFILLYEEDVLIK